MLLKAKVGNRKKSGGRKDGRKGERGGREEGEEGIETKSINEHFCPLDKS